MAVAGRDGKILHLKLMNTVGTTAKMIKTCTVKKVNLKWMTFKAWRQISKKTVYPSKFTKIGWSTNAQFSQTWQTPQSHTS